MICLLDLCLTSFFKILCMYTFFCIRTRFVVNKFYSQWTYEFQYILSVCYFKYYEQWVVLMQILANFLLKPMEFPHWQLIKKNYITFWNKVKMLIKYHFITTKKKHQRWENKTIDIFSTKLTLILCHINIFLYVCICLDCWKLTNFHSLTAMIIDENPHNVIEVCCRRRSFVRKIYLIFHVFFYLSPYVNLDSQFFQHSFCYFNFSYIQGTYVINFHDR